MAVDDTARDLDQLVERLPLRQVEAAARLIEEASEILGAVTGGSNDDEIARVRDAWQQVPTVLVEVRGLCAEITDRLHAYKTDRLGVGAGADAPSGTVSVPPGGRRLSREARKAIVSYENQIAAHEEKLRRYIENPYAHDNTSRLANEPNPQIREEIYRGRIKRLEKEIQRFRANIRKVYGEGL